ncbi:MAG TPA: GatB/YqeY domain-containing protein [Firmicutes bacterium]|nr:GatB/YqeY domain-containing protein [Bacillota bacterium]
MTIQEQLFADMKAAMKAREEGKVRLTTIRMVRAAIKNAEIAQGRPLTDEETIQVLAKEVKERKDSIPDFARGGRDDLVAKLEEEISILRQYLPEPLSEDEIRRLAQETIQEVKATGQRDLGKVMGAIIPKTRGRADGRIVNQIVRELLKH